MNKYDELKKKQRLEFKSIPMAVIYLEKDIKKEMEKLGLTENDKDKILEVGLRNIY